MKDFELEKKHNNGRKIVQRRRKKGRVRENLWKQNIFSKNCIQAFKSYIKLSSLSLYIYSIITSYLFNWVKRYDALHGLWDSLSLKRKKRSSHFRAHSSLTNSWLSTNISYLFDFQILNSLFSRFTYIYIIIKKNIQSNFERPACGVVCHLHIIRTMCTRILCHITNFRLHNDSKIG